MWSSKWWLIVYIPEWQCSSKVFTSIRLKAFTFSFGIFNASSVNARYRFSPVTSHTMSLKRVRTFVSVAFQSCILQWSVNAATNGNNLSNTCKSFPSSLPCSRVSWTGGPLRPKTLPSKNGLKFSAALHHLQSLPAIDYTYRGPALVLSIMIFYSSLDLMLSAYPKKNILQCTPSAALTCPDATYAAA